MKTGNNFLNPRMLGDRFDSHTIPLEVLKDIAVLEEMLIEVAKWLYLQDHPDRRRIPRGFAEGISLGLTSIGDGSAIPHVELFVNTEGFFPPGNQVYLERARESVVNAIDAAEHDQSITRHLPGSLLVFFDRIGRSLRDGESIEFNYPNKDKPARLTKATRRKLLLASSEVQEFTEEVALRGSIPKADQTKMTFELQLINGSRVFAPIAPHYYPTVLEAFHDYRHGARVLLRGVGRYNRHDRLEGIEAIEYLSLLEPNDIATRLDELRSLKNGWLDGKGFTLNSTGLDWLNQVFDRRYPNDLPLPYLYPTAEGGVQAEWSLQGHEITLEINLDTHQAEWQAMDMETEETTERLLDLDSQEAWIWLLERLHALSSAKQ